MTPTYTPTLDQVRQLAQQGNIIPIYRELPADLETPVSVYLKLCGQGRSNGTGPSFLLESVEKGEQLGRYSFIGLHPPLTITALGDQITVGGAGGTVLETRQGDPLDVVHELLAARKQAPVPGLPRFNGGVVGYFGYDLVRFMERLPATAQRRLDIPDLVLLVADNMVVFDHVRHRIKVIANMRVEPDLRAAYADAVARIDQIIADLRKPLTPPEPHECPAAETWQSNFTPAEFGDLVAARQGIHRLRRHLPGGAQPTPDPAHRGRLVHDLPGAAHAQPVALHVLPELPGRGRHRRGAAAAHRLEPGDARAVRGRLRAPAPHRRHPLARQDRRGGRRIWPPTCWRTPRNAPSTSCSWTWGATTWVGSPSTARSPCPP